MKKILLFILCIIWPLFECFAMPSPLKVTFIDVGHGDCILIQTPDDSGNGKYEGESILIDGGEQVKGKKVIIPYL